jgi:DNA-binding beta-propeller fold protein YncE
VLCHAPVNPTLVPQCSQPGHPISQAAKLRHDGAWWAQATKGMDFTRPDHLDSARFNAILWAGLKM